MTMDGQFEARGVLSRSPRVDTKFLVLLRCAAGKSPARITNLSATGFRLQTPRELEVGSEVTLETPKRPPVRCLIRWVAGTEAGGEFLEPSTF
jgi:hypothetical protein